MKRHAQSFLSQTKTFTTRIKRGIVHQFKKKHRKSQIPLSNNTRFLIVMAVGMACIGLVIVSTLWIRFPEVFIRSFMSGYMVITTILLIQSMFSLVLLTYAWNDPSKKENFASPKHLIAPKLSFSAIIAARNEARVIADTLRAVDHMDYPAYLKEIIVVLRSDDTATIHAAQRYLKHNPDSTIRIIISQKNLKNKPMSLNLGLQAAKNDVVVVFDAEDEPHEDLYRVVNTIIINKHADIVQGGVQLMNYHSNWFAPHNVLEYYFWFKSSLHVYANFNVVPLGGNTVFFKRSLIESLGGWDESLLTEDADIGLRASQQKASIAVFYDPKHATQEETPSTVKEFIRQRTRWSQGFLQIIQKGEWRTKTIHDDSQFLTLYILATPIFQIIWFIYLPVSLFISFFKLPVLVALFSFLPFYMLLFQAGISVVGMYLFTREYNKSFSWYMPIKILVTLPFYQFVLGWSALRASIRLFQKNTSWEKTEHTNVHRSGVEKDLGLKI